MPQSDNVGQLIEALSKAQAEFTVVSKTKTGREGNREFRYADLADVVGMVTPRLAKYGVFLSQPLVLDKNGEHLRQTTRLQLGEQFLQTDGIRLKDSSGAGKSLGAEVTYARRIDLNGLLGISPDDDLDAPDLSSGDKSSSIPHTAGTKPPPFAPKPQFRPGSAANVLNNKPSSLGGMINKDRGINPEITDADLPENIFDAGPPNIEAKLSPEATAVADHLLHFVPLTEGRNTEIQGRLKQLVKDKTLDRRKLALYLDSKHGDKKAFEVSATQWEETMKNIETAVAEGADSVKALLNEQKEK